MRIGFFRKTTGFLVVALAACSIIPLTAHAQGAESEAIALKKEAMADYGNLDLEAAVNKLDQAAAMGAQLSAGTVAQIYISYGVVYVGGHGDNARGQDYFTVACCLDPNVAIDPLFSSPEVDMIFKMAKARTDAGSCPQVLSNVSYMGAAGVAVAPPSGGGEISVDDLLAMTSQPAGQQAATMPMQPGDLPPCGVHNSPMQQAKSTELPLMVQIEPIKLETLDRVVLRYSYDGSGTYFEMDMDKGNEGWVTAMLTCEAGQITAFDPTAVNYYIEGIDMEGGVVCSNGTAAQPFSVAMTPGAPIVTGLAGMPTPQTCSECPPWDQDCHSAKQGGTPCFSDEECLSGQWCSDAGFCEGQASESGGDEFEGRGPRTPQSFYMEIEGGTGFGYTKTPNMWFINSTFQEPGNQNTYLNYTENGFSGGGAGGLPIRVRFGFHFTPNVSLELGGRLDISAAWRKQAKVDYCASSSDDYSHLSAKKDDDGNPIDKNKDGDPDYVCWAPLAGMGSSSGGYAFGGFRTQDGRIATSDLGSLADAWLANARVKVRFFNKGGSQVSAFGGAGYGHLYFAPKYSDLDGDGIKDRVVSTPGMVNLEFGVGYAFYLNSHFGFVVELPIDFVFGEESSFGFNADLMVGISFGG